MKTVNKVKGCAYNVRLLSKKAQKYAEKFCEYENDFYEDGFHVWNENGVDLPKIQATLNSIYHKELDRLIELYFVSINLK